MVRRFFLPTVLFAAMTLRAFAQVPGNLVQNGGFETGDFSGWIASGSPDDTFVSLAFPHSGAYGAVFGALDTPDYVSQTLLTSAGQTYVLSFWVSSGDTDGGTPNKFIVRWGGTTLLDRSNMVLPAWTNMEFLVTANANNTVLSFGGWDNPDYILLDDISVAVPPFVLSVPQVQSNGVVQFEVAGPPGLIAEIQASTNLLFWSRIGTVTNSSGPVIFTDPTATHLPRRFYRAVQGPNVPLLVLSAPRVRSNGVMEFKVAGTPGLIAEIQASTNLLFWSPIGTVTNGSDPALFTDATATNLPRRFYRAVQRP